MSSPASTPSRRRGKRGRGSNPPTRKCCGGKGPAGWAPGVFPQPPPRSAWCGGPAVVTPAPGPLVSCSARCSLSSFPEASDRRLHFHRGSAAHAHVPSRRRAEPRCCRCAVLQPAAVPPFRCAGAGAVRGCPGPGGAARDIPPALPWGEPALGQIGWLSHVPRLNLV